MSANILVNAQSSVQKKLDDNTAIKKNLEKKLQDLYDLELRKMICPYDAYDERSNLKSQLEALEPPKPRHRVYYTPKYLEDFLKNWVVCLMLGQDRLQYLTNQEHLSKFYDYNFFSEIWGSQIQVVYPSNDVLLKAIKEFIDEMMTTDHAYMMLSNYTYTPDDTDEHVKYQEIALTTLPLREFLSALRSCILLTPEEFSWLGKNQEALFTFQKIKETCPNNCYNECYCMHNDEELLNFIKAFIAECKCSSSCSCIDSVPLPYYYST
jgi:hypothetical protein